MLEFLLSNEWFYITIMAVVLIATILIICKYPGSRVYVFTFLGIALIGFTVYSGYQLDAYYNTRGGIFGYISGIVNNNSVEVEKVDHLTITLENIELLKEHEDSTIYSAEMLTNEAMTIDNEVNYALFINGQPISKVEYATDYVIAEYDYIFMGAEKEILCEDTLFIRFAFYSNSTYMSVSTAGGEEAVRFWNYYFNKNTFVLEFKESTHYSEGILDKQEIVLVSYYSSGRLFKKQYALEGQRVYLPTVENNFFEFKGWSLDGVNVVDYSAFDIVENTTFYAIFDETELSMKGKEKIELKIYTGLRKDIDRYTESLKIVGSTYVVTDEERYLTTYITINELTDYGVDKVLYQIGFANISTISEIENATIRMINAGTVEDIVKYNEVSCYIKDGNLDTVRTNISTIAGAINPDCVFVRIETTNRKGQLTVTINYIVVAEDILTGSVIREGNEYNLAYGELLVKVFGGEQ